MNNSTLSHLSKNELVALINGDLSATKRKAKADSGNEPKRRKKMAGVTVTAKTPVMIESAPVTIDVPTEEKKPPEELHKLEMDDPTRSVLVAQGANPIRIKSGKQEKDLIPNPIPVYHAVDPNPLAHLHYAHSLRSAYHTQMQINNLHSNFHQFLAKIGMKDLADPKPDEDPTTDDNLAEEEDEAEAVEDSLTDLVDVDEAKFTSDNDVKWLDKENVTLTLKYDWMTKDLVGFIPDGKDKSNAIIKELRPSQFYLGVYELKGLTERRPASGLYPFVQVQKVKTVIVNEGKYEIEPFMEYYGTLAELPPFTDLAVKNDGSIGINMKKAKGPQNTEMEQSFAVSAVWNHFGSVMPMDCQTFSENLALGFPDVTDTGEEVRKGRILVKKDDKTYDQDFECVSDTDMFNNRHAQLPDFFGGQSGMSRFAVKQDGSMMFEQNVKINPMSSCKMTIPAYQKNSIWGWHPSREIDMWPTREDSNHAFPPIYPEDYVDIVQNECTMEEEKPIVQSQMSRTHESGRILEMDYVKEGKLGKVTPLNKFYFADKFDRTVLLKDLSEVEQVLEDAGMRPHYERDATHPKNRLGVWKCTEAPCVMEDITYRVGFMKRDNFKRVFGIDPVVEQEYVSTREMITSHFGVTMIPQPDPSNAIPTDEPPLPDMDALMRKAKAAKMLQMLKGTNTLTPVKIPIRLLCQGRRVGTESIVFTVEKDLIEYECPTIVVSEERALEYANHPIHRFNSLMHQASKYVLAVKEFNYKQLPPEMQEQLDEASTVVVYRPPAEQDDTLVPEDEEDEEDAVAPALSPIAEVPGF